MIVRFWSARTNELQCRAYLEHFDRSVLPKLREFKGYVGVTTLTREADGQVEILVATVWRSLEAIQYFYGPEISAAFVGDDVAPLLTDFDRRVWHYDGVSTDN